jgi:hypothetical protein
MRGQKLGGTAMIAGAIMGLVTMALHPTGHAVMRDVAGQGALALAVHALALAGVPMVFYGGLVLCRSAERCRNLRSPSMQPPRWQR